MKRLTKRLLRCFIRIDAIDVNNVTKTPYDVSANHLENGDVEIGDEARALAISLRDEGMEGEVNLFVDHAKLFYIMLVKKLFEKFPFTSTVLPDLRILNPSERTTYKDLPNAVVRLAKHLPQLKLCSSLDALKSEAIDYQTLKKGAI